MSGLPGGSKDFASRLQNALKKARQTAPTGAGAGAKSAVQSAASAPADADQFNERISSALRKARGERGDDGQGVQEGTLESGGPVGTGDYIVRNGDCMASIAFQKGFFWETLWNDPANSELQTVRQDPFVLLPGDRVTIMEKRRKDESLAPEQRHRFVRKGAPEKLIVHFRLSGKPRANEAYTLEIDGQTSSGTSDPSGRVEIPIQPDARSGKITFTASGDVYDLDLGHLHPVSEVSGVQGRLRNLGFFTGPVDGKSSPALVDAVRSFQAKQQLEPTGLLDPATRSKLQEVYGA